HSNKRATRLKLSHDSWLSIPMIEHFKNFIRHGKQANKNGGAFDENKAVNNQNYTDEKVDNYTAVARIVAEEREQRNKLPNYPEFLKENWRLFNHLSIPYDCVLTIAIAFCFLKRRSLSGLQPGAFSNVYKAINVVTKEKVAIKVVRKRELYSTQERHLHRDVKVKPRATEGALRVDVCKIAFFINCRSNILKEVRIMRQLKHNSIVALKSFSESEDYYYLVLELMEGGELFHQIVRLTYFSEELTRHVIVQVAEGIRYLHEEVGVVHRDIKPENLLFEPIPFCPSKEPKPSLFDEPKEDEGDFIPGVGGGGIGRVKIADFGLSKVVWDEQTMTPCGTVGYTAPEIVKDERYSKSVDMWALGCVLYTLLCGFPPFYDESIRDLTEKVAKGQYTFLSPWWDNISDS
ncbi:10481_t:CDS:2, partial [Racocetra persica]